jgi:hypothetical protein
MFSIIAIVAKGGKNEKPPEDVLGLPTRKGKF